MAPVWYIQLVAGLCFASLSTGKAQFVPPAAILQAGYPSGFRAFIPDFPGCERFSFHGKLNTPFTSDNELGSFFQDILEPQRGFWSFEDPNMVLTPGDIIHYWTDVIKDKIHYPMKNLTWKVPDPNEAVDLLDPITKKPPKPTPAKMLEPEPTSPEEAVEPEEETAPTPKESETTEASSSTEPPKTTAKPSTTTKKPQTTVKPKVNKPKKNSPSDSVKVEEAEELTTPPNPLERPLSSEFPEEAPPLFPFPSLFPGPGPFRPNIPPADPCSNPWNFEEQLGETRTERLERQVAKLQCQLAQTQRGYTRLSNTVEKELTDMKKLVYGMVSRMSRLESLLRSAAFG